MAGTWDVSFSLRHYRSFLVHTDYNGLLISKNVCHWFIYCEAENMQCFAKPITLCYSKIKSKGQIVLRKNYFFGVASESYFTGWFMKMAIVVFAYTLSIATIWGKEHTLEPTLIQGFYALVQTTAAPAFGNSSSRTVFN